jgi:hypothetical protein
MPVISMFYDVIVLMYYFDNPKHHQPHIHVQYVLSKSDLTWAAGSSKLSFDFSLSSFHFQKD